MAIPVIQFQRREPPSGGLIEQVMGYGLTQLVGLPFEKARERRAEQDQIEAEQRGITNFIEQLRRQTEYGISVKSKVATAEEQAKISAGVSGGTLLKEEDLQPQAKDLYQRGLLAPTRRTAEGIFFDTAAVESALAGEQNLTPLAESFSDRIARQLGVDPKIVNRPTTRREGQEALDYISPNVQLMDIAARDRATREERLARLIETLDPIDYQTYGAKVIETAEGVQPFTPFDMSAIKNAPKLQQLSDAERNDPQVRMILERADELNRLEAEGKVRTVKIGQADVEDRKKPFFATDAISNMSSRAAALQLSNWDLLWEVRNNEFHRIPGRQVEKARVELQRNDDLLTAWLTFQSMADMQEVIDSEKVSGGLRLSPGALAYLQVMYAKARRGKWDHPRASYEGVALPPGVTAELGISRVQGDSVPPSPPPSPRRSGREIRGPSAGPGLPTPLGEGEQASGRSPTLSAGEASAERHESLYLEARDEIFTRLSTSREPDKAYEAIRQWVLTGHETPEAAAEFHLKLGAPDAALQRLRVGSDREKSVALAEYRNRMLQVIQDARSAWLKKQQ